MFNLFGKRHSDTYKEIKKHGVDAVADAVGDVIKAGIRKRCGLDGGFFSSPHPYAHKAPVELLRAWGVLPESAESVFMAMTAGDSVARLSSDFIHYLGALEEHDDEELTTQYQLALISAVIRKFDLKGYEAYVGY